MDRISKSFAPKRAKEKGEGDQSRGGEKTKKCQKTAPAEGDEKWGRPKKNGKKYGRPQGATGRPRKTTAITFPEGAEGKKYLEGKARGRNKELGVWREAIGKKRYSPRSRNRGNQGAGKGTENREGGA